MDVSILVMASQSMVLSRFSMDTVRVSREGEEAVEIALEQLTPASGCKGVLCKFCVDLLI